MHVKIIKEEDAQERYWWRVYIDGNFESSHNTRQKARDHVRYLKENKRVKEDMLS